MAKSAGPAAYAASAIWLIRPCFNRLAAKEKLETDSDVNGIDDEVLSYAEVEGVERERVVRKLTSKVVQEMIENILLPTTLKTFANFLLI